jgi:hypothetical protein
MLALDIFTLRIFDYVLKENSRKELGEKLKNNYRMMFAFIA